MAAHYESFGKYVLLEKLATGGMAEVFLARGTGAGGIGKFFAIKRILPQYADSPEFIDMFKDEAKIAINLSHSNIVSIHEFGVEKGQFFLVMDYVEGRNLRQILNKMKKSGLQFSVDQIVFIMKEVAAGLDHAHRCIDGTTGRPLNITHRDMSPQNVMVSFEGEVKIVDFGIAKAESQIETTRAGTLKGKFGYMSPEQAEGQPVDLRTDIFSLGICMWELLANDRLFVANNEINTLRKIRDCQIPSLRKINPNIHTELERISQKSLARDRNLRYQTGAALHRDLNRFLNRQYPDFSAQDFSVFIKSVFADEILSLRKRLVDYAKVNLSIELTIPKEKKESEHDDQTSLLDTNTSSVIVDDSTQATKSSQVTEKNSDLISVTNASNPTLEISELTRTDPNASIRIGKTQSGETTKVVRAKPHTNVLNDAALENLKNPVVVQGRSKVTPLSPNPTQPPPNLKLPPTPDAQQATIIQPMPTVPSSATLETEEVTSPSIRTSRPSPRTQVGYDVNRGQGAKPARFATFLVFAFLCVGAYAYLVKYFTDSMCGVIRTTNPIMSPLHDSLGVQPCGRKITSDVPQQLPALRPTPSPLENIGGGSGLVVTSNPSGAEIWVDGRPTGKTTPIKIDVPQNETFSIALKKRGYTEYRRLEVTRESLGHKLDANLQKMNVGYLDIEIFPPQEAILFVNGKQVSLQRTVAREVLVPANTPIKVRAESRDRGTYEEMTVTVPLDRKRNIKLNPRKNARVPAGS